MVRLEHQKQLAQRIRRRRPARWQTLKEPRRTLEAVCFLRVTLLQKTDVLITLIDRDILKLRRQTVGKVRKENMALGVLRPTLSRGARPDLSEVRRGGGN
jgi:hypothetical protein